MKKRLFIGMIIAWLGIILMAFINATNPSFVIYFLSSAVIFIIGITIMKRELGKEQS